MSMTKTTVSPWSAERGLQFSDGSDIETLSGWSPGKYRRTGVSAVVRLTGTAPEWLVNSLRRLTTFSGYSPNWNGYGERAISGPAVLRAASLLRDVAAAGLGQPSAVVPLATGGVQVEWGDDGDVVLEVSPDGDVDAYLADNDFTWPIREQTDFDQLGRFLARL